MGTNSKLDSVFYLTPFYFIFVGALYLMGYWSTFGINIFGYLEITDIIMITIYPIASAFVFTAAGMFVGDFMSAENKLIKSSKTQHKSEPSKLVAYILRNITDLKILLILIAAAVFLFAGDRKWVILPLLITCPLYWHSKELGVLENQIKNDRLRSTLVFLLITLPFFSFGQGKTNSLEILKNKNYYTFESQKKVSINNEDRGEYKYLGHVGDYVFFASVLNNEVYISKVANIGAFKITKAKRLQL